MTDFPLKLSQSAALLERLIYWGGVNVLDPDSAWISPEVNIGRGTVIYPNSYLIGKAGSKIGENCEIGPGAYLREWFEIGNRVKIGFNAEIVRSIIGEGTKIPHFCHVGDASIGRYCNIAAGVVFCNYNGDTKHSIIVKDHVFIGSGAKLIAPLVIADRAYIAAGAIVSKYVNPCDIIIGANKVVENKKSCYSCQENKPNWRIHPITETGFH